MNIKVIWGKAWQISAGYFTTDYKEETEKLGCSTSPIVANDLSKKLSIYLQNLIAPINGRNENA